VDPGDAWVGFTAERVMILDGRRYVGRIWHMPGGQRHGEDLTALSPVLILRRQPVGEIVCPQLHTLFEFVRPKALSILKNPELSR
jgi:hypothetical protein